LSVSDLILYFESIEKLYPAGIPTRLLTVELDKSNSSELKVLFLGPELSTAGVELIKAAANKGLKLLDTQFKVFSINSLNQNDVEDILKRENPACLVLFGNVSQHFKNVELLLGKRQSLYGVEALYTLSPESVCADVSLKKEFWTQLQIILEII